MPTYGFDGLVTSLDEIAGIWQRERSIAFRIDEHAQAIVDRAKAKIGEYQPAVAEWPAWEELAESTRAHKAAMGAPDDQPLLGVDDAQHMRDDIAYRIVEDAGSIHAEIGIPVGAHSADYALVQEMGSQESGAGSPIPERPFLRPAIYEEEDAYVAEIKSVLAQWQRRAELRSRKRLMDKAV